MTRASIMFIIVALSTAAVLPEVTSYAKVSRNGEEVSETKSGSSSWIGRDFSGHDVNRKEEEEGRSVKDIVITVSPIFVTPRNPKLQNGQVIEYPSGGRYSTLDHEMIAKMEAKKQIQDRYHPSAYFPGNNGQSMDNTQKNSPKPPMPPDKPPNSEDFDYKPMFSGGFDYKPPDYLNDKPMPKPITMDDYPNSEMGDKPSDSFKPQPDPTYYSSHDHDSDFPDFQADSYNSDDQPKPIEFSGHLEHPPYDDEGYHHDHKYHHEIIYDHLPEYHDHQHDQTEQPEMNDQRLDKRPYSYYFIGKKLWYVPLYFSIYFIIYIAALVLKSIARHKITFPSHLAEAVGHSRRNMDTSWWDYTGSVLQGLENFAEKFGKVL